jgi:hypothetical protein
VRNQAVGSEREKGKQAIDDGRGPKKGDEPAGWFMNFWIFDPVAVARPIKTSVARNEGRQREGKIQRRQLRALRPLSLVPQGIRRRMR